MNLSKLKQKWQRLLRRLRLSKALRRQRREWKRLPLTEYPLEYVGPTDMFIANGTPLAPVTGIRGGQGAGRYVRPNGLEIHLNKKTVDKRKR